jgi:hypothetical protein
MENVLYVEAYLPTGADLANYSLSLVPVDGSAEISVTTWNSVSRVHGPFAVSRPIVQHGITRTAEFEMYIILLDLVDGTTDNPSRIEELGIATPKTVHARVTEKGTSFGEMSTTFAHTLFYGDMNGGFEVQSARHLYNIRYQLDGNYYQTDEIDMKPSLAGGVSTINDINNFTPIGTDAFTGTYDAYHTPAPYAIRNLTVSHAANNIGLFGSVSGTVQYLNLAGVTISGTGNVGAVAGQSSGTIVEVDVSGTVTGTADNAGGLVGLNSGTIIASTIDGTVTGKSHVGGMVGENSGTISASTSTADVFGVDTGTNVGGLVGLNSGTLKTPKAEGITISGTGTNIGGIAGFTSAAIQDAEVKGITVTGTGENNINLGGVVGEARGPNAQLRNIVVGNLTDTDGNTIRSTLIQGRTFLGGVAGRTNNEIKSADVIGIRLAASFSQVGGIVGLADKHDTITAVIDDVTVEGISIIAERRKGPDGNFGGGDRAGGIAGETKVRITNAKVIDTVITAQGEDAGGIAGRAEDVDATISDVIVSGATISVGRAFAGGVVGETLANITKATVNGETTVTGDYTFGESRYVGGIVGRTTADVGGNTSDDYIIVADVEVTGRDGQVGGILGGIADRAWGRPATENVDIIGVTLNAVTVGGITNSDGSIATPNYVGGVVGWLSPILDPDNGVTTATANITKASLTNVSVTGADFIGGVAGEFAPVNGGNITDVTLDGTSAAPTSVKGNKLVGGVVGQFTPGGTGSITNVHVTGAEVNGGGYGPTGGILGGTTEDAGNTTKANVITIANVSVTGATINGASQVGGVAGEFAHVNSSAAIGDATENGIKVTGTTVTGTGEKIGGVAGEISTKASVTNATVSGGTTVQNLVGDGDPHGNAVGGIVGTNGGTLTTVAVTDSTVKGRYMVGGVAGLSSNAITDADVTNTGVTSRRSNAGGIAGEVNNTAGVILNATVTGGATGNVVTGGGNFIGGAVGKTSANMTNVTVSGMSVASTGGGSVGGVLGGNEATTPAITNVIAVETKVHSHIDNVGGIVGILNGSTLKNATYISVANDTPITLTPSGNQASIGGIVGHNPTGTISDVLFLALAPKGTDGKIVPITKEVGKSVTNAYYLRGQPVRPNEVATGRDGYNMEDAVGPGAGYSTWELNSRFGDLVTLNADWEKNGGFTAPDHVDSTKDTFKKIYPYPYIKGLTTLTDPNWPIAKNDVIMGPEMQYFEWTGGTRYYVWNGGDRPNDGMKNDGENLMEAGYAFIYPESLVKNQLYARPAGSTKEWQAVGFPALTNNALAVAMGEPTYTPHILPLKGLAAVVGDSDTPLELMFKNKEDAEVLLSSYIHPLFAKAVFNRNATDYNTLHPPKFYVRTAWQMQNIGKLTTTEVNGLTKGKTFIQDRSFSVVAVQPTDSELWMGVNANADPSGIAQHTLVEGGNIGDYFSGTFVGTGFEITDLKFGKGLFATVSGDTEEEKRGKITGVTVRNHTSEAIGDLVSTIALRNEGIIEKCKVSGSVFKGRLISQVGFIAGENTTTIRDCVVEDCVLEDGYNNVGGVVAVCSGTLERIGVINTTLKATGDNIGGIVGSKSGKTIQDVFFLSTVTPAEIADGSKAPPVPTNSGKQVGGIVGTNNAGTVTRALYLAPAPANGTDIYPIVHTSAGIVNVTENFYLYGLRHRVMPVDGGAWTEETYNGGKPQNGGEPMNTLELDLASLVYMDGKNMPGWDDGAGNYPYPILIGMESPKSWPEAEGSDRPAQASRNDWGNPKNEVRPELDFVNGDFGDAYLPGKPNTVGPPLLPLPDAGPDEKHSPINLWEPHDLYTNMTNVAGWSTRPTEPANPDLRNYWYIMEPMMPYIDPPNNPWGLMPTDYKGNGVNFPGDLTVNPNDATYFELNAEVPGTLYQIADTIPGQEFYYSFHHATRLHMDGRTAGNDMMNFFLSPTGSRLDPLTNPIADEDNMWLIRPVESPRNVVRPTTPSGRAVIYPRDALGGNPNSSQVAGYNYAAWDTVRYEPGATARMAKYWTKHFPEFPESGVYLYDVWIGPLESTDASANEGYGLTFWSTQRYDLALKGYDRIAGLAAITKGDENNIIGYWDIDNGWKQCYGSYIVPEGQKQTEFAYQSVRGSAATYGNLLDGAVFMAEATLSVSETMYRTATKAGDVTPREEAGVVDAGDTITVEMTVKSEGGAGTAKARDVQLINQLKPFDQYAAFANNVMLDGKPVAAGGYKFESGVFTMELDIEPGQSQTISFDIKVLSNLYGDANNYSTLFYHIENQAEVRYTGYREGRQVSAAGVRGRYNASVRNQRVSISEIPMSKTVALVGNLDADGNLVPVNPVTTSATAPQVGETGSVFEVVLSFSGKVAATGLVSDALPPDFSLVEGSIEKSADGTTWVTVQEDERILYGTDKEDRRMVFLNVNFAAAAEKTYYFRYRMTYEGDKFGVTYAGVNAYYRFRYGQNSIQLPVIEPRLGIRAAAENEHFIVPDEGGTIPNLIANSNTNRADLPYAGISLLPKIEFYEDAEGKIPLSVTDSEGHTVIVAEDYMATLMNDNSLNFASDEDGKAIPARDYILYYRIVANDAVSGFDLRSEGVGTITITVDADAEAVSSVQAALPSPPDPDPGSDPGPADPDPSAALPAPPPVLPPAAAATLGLLGAALGGGAAGLGVKNGVSAAYAALLGTVSLLLLLTGLALLPEKKRRPRRAGRALHRHGGRYDDE